MNAFHSQWINLNHDTIMIVRTGNLLEVKYGNGRDPFIGAEIDLYAPVSDLDDSEVRACNTGVLTQSGEIEWSDDVERQQRLPRRPLVNDRAHCSMGSRYF